MQAKRIFLVGALAGALAVGIAAEAQADGGLPPQAGCPAQFNHDFKDIFGPTSFGPTISSFAQNTPGLPELKPQATSPHDACFIDLTP
jgi:hypothetical protein